MFPICVIQYVKMKKKDFWAITDFAHKMLDWQTASYEKHSTDSIYSQHQSIGRIQLKCKNNKQW